MIKPQKDFPLLEKYKQRFNVTPETVFAYKEDIYSNTDLPMNTLEHELTHIAQQAKMGADEWVDRYFESDGFRLRQEVEAYRNELQCFTDRNERYKQKIRCAKVLSSDLYGGIISLNDALKLL